MMCRGDGKGAPSLETIWGPWRRSGLPGAMFRRKEASLVTEQMEQACTPSAWAVCQPTVPQPHGPFQFLILVLQQNFLWVCFFPFHMTSTLPTNSSHTDLSLIVSSSGTTQDRPNSGVVAPRTHSPFLELMSVLFLLQNQK